MKVQLDKTYDLPGPAAAAWAVLSNVQRVAGCMPGAKITAQVDDTHYKGTVAVKFGPASMSFRGDLEVARLDAATQTLRLIGKGTDTAGGSGANMNLTARIEAADAMSSRLVGSAETTMSGKAAAFGARLAQSVADQVLKQFVANFAAQVQAEATAAQRLPGEAPATPPNAAAGDSVNASAIGAGSDAAAGLAPAPASVAPASTSMPSGAQPASQPAPQPAPQLAQQPAPQLNALALAWAVVKEGLRSLFGRRGDRSRSPKG